jgi:hypothetical protein
MASVANNKTQVQVAGKVDGQLDLGDVGDVEGVRWEPSQRAVLAESSALGLTGGTLEERGHERGRMHNAVVECQHCFETRQ